MEDTKIAFSLMNILKNFFLSQLLDLEGYNPTTERVSSTHIQHRCLYL